MPKHYQSKSLDRIDEQLTAAREAERNNLTRLVRDYEAVRLTHGQEHDKAERALGVALSRHPEPFRLDDFIWQWSRVEQSVVRHRSTKPLASSHRK